MKNKKILAILLSVALAFSAVGCGAAGGSLGTTVTAALTDAESAVDTDSAVNSSSVEELFTARDLGGESGEAVVTVTLSGDTAAADGAGVSVSDGLVAITAGGDYLLTGSFSGSVVVDVEESEKVQLILSGAAIESEGQSSIVVLSADKVFLTLAENSENTVSASGELAALGEVNADGAIFSKCDLTINGTGSLSVDCETGHGIVSKDDLRIASGTITVDAAKQGLSGKDSVSIADGTISITAGTDAIHSENADDAEKGVVTILGGSITAESGSDGIDASGTVSIEGGEISVRASDDGLNAAGGNDGSNGGGWFGGDPFAAQDASITISGGSLTVNADGDGIDSNGDLTVSGGTICVSGPTNSGNGALDYNGSGVITGGTLIAAGASGMAENFSNGSTQCSMLVSFSGTISAGSEICVYDSQGKLIASYTPEKSYQCAVISCPELTVGESYTVTAGGTQQSVTLSSTITGGGMGMGGPGGFGGGQGGQGGPGGFGGHGGGRP